MAVQDIKPSRSDNSKAALDALYKDIASKSLFPFWATTTAVDHDEVKQLLGDRKPIAHHWNYRRDVEPLLYRAAELISLEDLERRSLVLINPGLAPARATTGTLYSAYRLNDPHEVMPPHRHTPNAIRFGLTGKGNFTGVEGEDITFGPGDMVLTPSQTWHNHGNVGADPAVNLSVLDLPLVQAMHAISFQHDYKEMENGKLVPRKVQSARVPSDYSARIYGDGGLMPRFVSHHRGTGNASPMYVYRWEAMQAALERFKNHDGDPYEAIMIEYVNPITGGPTFKSMTFFVQLLRPGERTKPLRQTASLLMTPFEGKGHTMVGSKRIDWDQFDTVVMPAGEWCEHVNGSDSAPAILFVSSDEPTLKAFGLYNKYGRTDSGETVTLV